MKRALITGSGGLIGFEACRFLLEKGFEVHGIDNNMRRYFFGEKGDTSRNISSLKEKSPNFKNYNLDIRNKEDIESHFRSFGPFEIIIHTAAQPSHDWAAKEPHTDFGVNAIGTLNLLEATRHYSKDSTFIFISTNKVYGDSPNDVPLTEDEERWEYDLMGEFIRPELKIGVSVNGINEFMTLDQSKHSLFGASKVAADILAQEYGKYFGLNIGIFRGGCLTGPQHSGVELHGFLNYIIHCAKTGKPYTIFGYKGKQVRDQIHSYDVVNAFWHFHQGPRKGEVYNLGGGKENSASMEEVIRILEGDFNLKLNYSYSQENRVGDHICYYSDMSKFKRHYPNWQITKNLHEIIREMVEG